MFKKLKSIEVGAHEDKVGYTATYQNGEREHHLFAPAVALQLCEHLGKLARAAQIKVADEDVTVGMAKPQTERQSGFTEQVGISDSANIGLSTPEGDDDGKKKIH